MSVRKLLVTLFLLSASLHGQWNENGPIILQSVTSGADLQSCAATNFPFSLTSGSLILGYVNWTPNPGNGEPTATTISGSLQAYTNSASVCQSGTEAHHSTCHQYFYILSSAAGAETLTSTPNVAGTQCNMLVEEIKLPSAYTLDVAQASNNYGTGSSLTESLSVTSTNDGDIMALSTGGCTGATLLEAALPPLLFGASGDGGADSLLSTLFAGTNGSYTMSHKINNGLGCLGGVISSIAFTPGVTMVVSTSAIPDGCVCATYDSGALTATGGVGAYTWSIVSGVLPTGLSLVGSHITGTPTQGGTFTIGVHATDTAAHTSNTQSFTFKVGATLHTVSLAAVISQSTCIISGTNYTCWPFTGLSPGDVLFLPGQCCDSKAYDGYLEKTSAITDDCSITFHRIAPICGTRDATMMGYVGVVPTSCTTDNVIWRHQGTGSWIGGVGMDLSGAQGIIDPGSCNTDTNGTTTSETLTTQTYSQLVPNEYLIAWAGTHYSGSLPPWSFNSPFSTIATSSFGLVPTVQTYASYVPGAVGGYTATVVGSSLPTGANMTFTATLIGFRPSIASMLMNAYQSTDIQ